MGNSAALGRLPRAGRGPRSALLLRVASDDRLVTLVRGGSEAAFEAVYDRHHRGILAFCRHMLSSPDEAEDAVQHTFMAAYRHLAAGSGEIHLRPWLYTIARNRCLSLLRARRERPLDEHHEPATEYLSAEAQRRQDVRDLLADVAALPEDQRAALVLAELGAVSHDEIAMVLEVPRQKVKALVFQARTSLVASRTARATPCAEIREQLANLRGGALRRTTVHRHLRECPGCRAFREEVALQRKTLAVALPVIPTLGLKEAALGAAFGSAGAGGGAAAATAGGALAAKALVTVALVGGGATAGVEVTDRVVDRVAPAAVERSGGGGGAESRGSSVPVTLEQPARGGAEPVGGQEDGHAAPGRTRGEPAVANTAEPATGKAAPDTPKAGARGEAKQAAPKGRARSAPGHAKSEGAAKARPRGPKAGGKAGANGRSRGNANGRSRTNGRSRAGADGQPRAGANGRLHTDANSRPAGANGRSRTDGSRTDAKPLQGSAEAGSRAADRSVPPGAAKAGPRAEPKADPHRDAAAPLPIAADAPST